MAAEYPPFMNGYGTATKIFAKIKEAQTPDRFTQDFLSTKLGFTGGTPKPFLPLAKRLGFLDSDGKPTDLYKSFRNPAQSKAAMAAAIKKGYSKLMSTELCLIQPVGIAPFYEGLADRR